MRCKQVKELLSAYLDNMLALHERHQISKHVQTCKGCRTMLADFHLQNALLAQLPAVLPRNSLRLKLFTSAEYYELTGTSGISQMVSITPSALPTRWGSTSRPYLVVMQGGKNHHQTQSCSQRRQFLSRPLVLMLCIVVILLSFALSLYTGWYIW